MQGKSRLQSVSRLGLAPVILSVLFAVAACNTIEGMGKDIEKGGEAVQGGSKDVKEKL